MEVKLYLSRKVVRYRFLVPSMLRVIMTCVTYVYIRFSPGFFVFLVLFKYFPIVIINRFILRFVQKHCRFSLLPSIPTFLKHRHR